MSAVSEPRNAVDTMMRKADTAIGGLMVLRYHLIVLTERILVKCRDRRMDVRAMAEKERRVFVVEDDPVVAMVVEDSFRDMGWTVVVDLSLENALYEIESSDFDAALVDVGLRGESARPVILALLDRGIPFLVMSGGDLSALAAEFPHIRMILKPLEMEALKRFMQELLDRPR